MNDDLINNSNSDSENTTNSNFYSNNGNSTNGDNSQQLTTSSDIDTDIPNDKLAKPYIGETVNNSIDTVAPEVVDPQKDL